MLDPKAIRHLSATALLIAALAGCAVFSRTQPNAAPEEEMRHRAALSQLIVHNRTEVDLTIAFRTPAPPPQEVVIGTVRAGARGPVAPIPAGEPVVLVARTADGAELTLPARSYPLDAEWTWDIPATAVFRKQESDGPT